MKGTVCLVCVVLASMMVSGVSFADDLSIYDVQYTTDPSGDSPYNLETHNVLGGIVTHIWFGGKARVYLQDPAEPTWGGIMVKDWTGGFVLANGVSIGDRVDLSTVYVEEAPDKNTVLQFGAPWEPGSSFTVVSSGNPVPDPILLTAADIPIPTNHEFSERYESMVITLEDVEVGLRDLGRKDDNYELLQGSDVAWGTDYQNIDAGGPYHPLIYTGSRLDSITGIVEQGFGDPNWDYYQLVTRSTYDIVPETEVVASIDIKPGSCPNSFNPGSRGVFSVALVGTDEFDVAAVDPSSIELSRADGVGGSVAPYEGPPGPHSVFDDVATPFDGEPCDCHEQTGDGIIDLSMKFQTGDVVAALELDSPGNGMLVELVLSGDLDDGTPFAGRDCIRLVPPVNLPTAPTGQSNVGNARIDGTLAAHGAAGALPTIGSRE